MENKKKVYIYYVGKASLSRELSLIAVVSPAHSAEGLSALHTFGITGLFTVELFEVAVTTTAEPLAWPRFFTHSDF